MDLRAAAERPLGPGAGESRRRRSRDEDAVARPDVGHAVARGLDRSRRVGVGGIGKLDVPVGPAADVGVDGVDAHGLDADDHLSGAGDRIGHLFDPEHVGTAVFADAEGFHTEHDSRFRRNLI